MGQRVSDVFTAISRELRHLSELTLALQDSLSPRDQPIDVGAFQSLDLLTQTLDCLAAYVADVSAIVPTHLSVETEEVAGRMPLAALAKRLRGDLIEAGGAGSSEVELF